MLTKFRARSSSTRSGSRRRLHLESLEERAMMYADTGYSWSDTDISFSFVPDGTNAEGSPSALFSKLNAVASTDVWQRELARALQTWANSSTLNFHQVSDDGSPNQQNNVSQGDSRFGDIRLAAHNQFSSSWILGHAYYPGNWAAISGDIFLNTDSTFRIGANPDLFSVLLHESGHSLGLSHSSGSVMNSSITGVYTGLTADDIAGIQAKYGARQQDAFDLNGSNNSRGTASSVFLDSDGEAHFAADLTTMGDSDYYAFVAPSTTDGFVTVSVDASGISLLAPSVSLYDSSGTLVASASVGGAYGTTATVNFNGVTAGETYYVRADGATADEFGMGAYQLDVGFGLASGGANNAPNAVNDAYGTLRNKTLTTGNVLSNDGDMDGDTLIVASFTQASHGTVTNIGNGRFSYTPTTNYYGNDSFTYTVSDGRGGYDTANVTLTVSPASGTWAQDRAYVRELYVDLLHRNPDNGGWTYWVGRLQSGTTREQIVGNFTLSVERLSPIVNGYYARYLHRGSDAVGRSYWISELRSGRSIADVESFFVNSPEYSYFNASNGAFVDALYRDILYRHADQGGRNFWISELNRGRTRTNVSQFFLSSREKIMQTIDAYYADAFDQKIDNASRQLYLDQINNGTHTIDSLIESWLISDAYYNRASGN